MEISEHGPDSTPVPEKVNGQFIPGPEGAALPETHAAPVSTAPLADNVDRIRDILFGGHMREYDRRFTQLEERMLRATADLEEKLSKRFAALESYVRREVETLAEDIRSERTERTGAGENAGRTVAELTANVERKTQQLAEQAARIQRELRQQILDEHTFLVDEDRRHRDELHGVLKRHFGDLHDGKVDRFAMADLLSEVSARLKGQFRLPQLEGFKDGGLPR